MDKKFKVFVIIALIALAGLAATGTIVALSVVNEANSDQSGERTSNKNLTTVSLNDPIIANLNGKGKVRISVGLELDSKDKTFKDFNTQFDSNELIIRDKIINILRNQTYEKLTQASSQQDLAEIIKNEINGVLGSSIINQVYFGEFFVD